MLRAPSCAIGRTVAEVLVAVHACKGPSLAYHVDMAHIRYRPESELAPEERVADPDNIVQIHAVHPTVMRQHFDLYRELMHAPGPLSRREREVIAVRVSALNSCHY